MTIVLFPCRDNSQQHSVPPIGLSTIVEEKDITDCCEDPIFVDGTPAEVQRPLGRSGSLKVISRKPASLSAERRRLQHVLEFIGGEQLRERLAVAIQSEDDMVERLAALLPDAMFPGKVRNPLKTLDLESG